jgi:hypothetical protein
VAELGAQAARAAEDPPADHHAAAHARAQGEHHEVLRRVVAHELRLGEGRAVGVVVEVDGDAEAGGQLLAERDALERDVHAADDRAGGEVDLRRHPDADRVGLAGGVRHLADRGLDPGHQGVRATQVGGVHDGVEHLGPGDPRGGHLRAAHVDADHGRISRSLHRLSPPRPRPETYALCARNDPAMDRRLANKNLRTGLIAGAISLIFFGAAFLVAAAY